MRKIFYILLFLLFTNTLYIGYSEGVYSDNNASGGGFYKDPSLTHFYTLEHTLLFTLAAILLVRLIKFLISKKSK